MLTETCFDPALIFLDVDGDTPGAVIHGVSEALAAHLQVPVEAIARPLRAQVQAGQVITVAPGVALPHAAVEGLSRHSVAVVRSRQAFALGKGAAPPVDLFFVPLVPKGRTQLHLNVLAHMARILRSRILLTGLRQATTPADALALLQATEARIALAAQDPAPIPQRPQDLVLVEITGEQAVDRLLVDLIEEGFEDAVVAEGQHLREVMASQLPLFAGFRDLFDDPGGLRLLFIGCAPERTETLLGCIREACELGRSEFARVMVLPVRQVWTWQPEQDRSSGGH